jgi:hypothetical protein
MVQSLYLLHEDLNFIYHLGIYFFVGEAAHYDTLFRL